MHISIAKITQFSGHIGSIYALVVSSDGKFAYSSGGDGYVVKWDLHGSGDGLVIAKVDSPVYCLYLFNDESRLLIGTSKGDLNDINLMSNEIEKSISLESGSIFSMYETKTNILIGTENGEIIFMSKDLSEVYLRSKISKASVRALCMLNEQLIYASSDNSIGALSKNGEVIEKIDAAHSNSVFSIIPVGDKLWSGSRDAHIKIWEGFKCIEDIPAHSGHVNSLDFNKESNLVVSGSMDKTVKIWNSETGELLKVLSKEKMKFHHSSVNKVLWIGPNEFISCADDRTLIKTKFT